MTLNLIGRLKTSIHSPKYTQITKIHYTLLIFSNIFKIHVKKNKFEQNSVLC